MLLQFSNRINCTKSLGGVPTLGKLAQWRNGTVILYKKWWLHVFFIPIQVSFWLHDQKAIFNTVNLYKFIETRVDFIFYFMESKYFPLYKICEIIELVSLICNTFGLAIFLVKSRWFSFALFPNNILIICSSLAYYIRNDPDWRILTHFGFLLLMPFRCTNTI